MLYAISNSSIGCSLNLRFMGPNSTGLSVGRSVVSFCVTVSFQGHESVAFGFHFSNIFITFLYQKGGTFSAVFHFFMFNYIQNMKLQNFIGYNMQ